MQYLMYSAFLNLEYFAIAVRKTYLTQTQINSCPPDMMKEHFGRTMMDISFDDMQTKQTHKSGAKAE